MSTGTGSVVQSPRDGQRPETTMPRPPRDGSGSMMPPRRDDTGSNTKDDTMIPLPPRDGSGSMIPRPPKPEDGSGMTRPPQEGLSSMIERLSSSDREELMKVIRAFLESKGIKPPM